MAIGTIVVLLHLAAVVGAAALTYLCIHPILSFVRRGWVIKREEVMASLDTEAKLLYLKMFLKVDSGPKQAAEDFDKMFLRRYGRYRLTVPAVLFALVLLPLTFLVTETALGRLILVNNGAASEVTLLTGQIPFVVLPGTAVAAIVGAYTWVAYALVLASWQYNMPPTIILVAVLRLTVAAPLGYAVASLATKGLAPFVAFAIGVFPLETVQTLLQRLANKQLNLNIGIDAKDPGRVDLLDGIDSPKSDKLQMADVTTIAQLAYYDPVQLSLRTNLTFDFVVDIVDQALAWNYLGEKLSKMRPMGLRGAVEIYNLVRDMGSEDARTKNAAHSTYSTVAKAVDIDASGLWGAFQEIAWDPYTEFLQKVWPVATYGAGQMLRGAGAPFPPTADVPVRPAEQT
jgi:hypothetical protein